jgi:hypothetical protein
VVPAKIDGDNIMTFRIFILRDLIHKTKDNHNKEKVSLVNGSKTISGKFEKLTEKQLFQLVTAGVVLLIPQQVRPHGFFMTKPETKENKIAIMPFQNHIIEKDLKAYILNSAFMIDSRLS